MVGTALLYARTLTYPFVYEDLNDVGLLLGSPLWAWPGGHRLLTSLSFTLSRLLSGVDPWGWHAVSLALHLLNGWLLWTLLRRSWLGVFALALFLVHPIQVEAVAYVSARADVVMTTCVVAGLVAVERHRWGWALVAACLAVLAKESGVIAVPLLLLYGWWRHRLSRRMVLIGLVASVPGALWVLWRFGALLQIDPTYTGHELVKVGTYLTLLVLPVSFTIDRDWQWITSQDVALACVCLAGLVSLALLEPRSRVVFGAAFVGLAVLPRLLVPLLEGLHEHHFYLPLVGVALAVGGVQQEQG